MFLRQFRLLSLLITLLLACLQGLVPLLHAHPAGHITSDTQSGIHLHEVDAQSFQHYEGYSILADDSPHAIEVGLAHQPKDALLLLAIFVLVALRYPRSWPAPGWQQRTHLHIPLLPYSSALLRAPPQH